MQASALSESAAARRCDATSGVSQLLMISSHVTGCPSRDDELSACRVQPLDARLLDRYALELRTQPNTAAWLLLYREGYDQFTRVQLAPPGATPCQSCANASVCMWGERAVWKRFPRLEQAIRTHPHIHKEPRYLQFYYWFHASLLVWLEMFGPCYPKAKYIWRVEPDVLFAGTVDQLVDLSNNEPADVLLPEVQFAVNGSVQSNHYHHFAYQTFLDTLSSDRVVWSLVSIGRYSTRFLSGHMARLWAAGVAGYEEILLPTACLNATNCRVAAFNGWDSVSAHHVVFRTADPGGPPRFWHCSEFKEALMNKDGMLDLWHPVKDRSCLIEEAELASAEAHGLLSASCSVCPRAAAAQPSPSEALANLRALRRRSVAWADRFRDREMRERPFLAQRRERERARLEDAQAAPPPSSSRKPH